MAAVRAGGLPGWAGAAWDGPGGRMGEKQGTDDRRERGCCRRRAAGGRRASEADGGAASEPSGPGAQTLPFARSRLSSDAAGGPGAGVVATRCRCPVAVLSRQSRLDSLSPSLPPSPSVLLCAASVVTAAATTAAAAAAIYVPACLALPVRPRLPASQLPPTPRPRLCYLLASHPAALPLSIYTPIHQPTCLSIPPSRRHPPSVWRAGPQVQQRNGNPRTVPPPARPDLPYSTLPCPALARRAQPR
ncbi:hypothetical protein BS50DRAFT_585679 [Corynespora cassiicola Philippines]|uniref:Uncharacterized protein n=1 Tax=Corynespora cassiicola Philippines TaxID=1448308 RepID=A0A2T2NXT4_CORCC|nr:hypothetical protein BS50DRAFT_585679 [Corynespora cassiicola Philippines]